MGRPVGKKDSNPRKKKKIATGKKKEMGRKPVAPAQKPSEQFVPKETVPHPRLGDNTDNYGPRNVSFEQKLRGSEPRAKQTTAKVQAPATKDQSDIEIKLIANFLKLPFTFWATRIKLASIRLTDAEAKEWAEPTKILLDHYMPLMPPIGYAWIAWSITTITVMDKRLELIAAEKAGRPKPANKNQKEVIAQERAKRENFARGQQGAPDYKPKRS